MGQRGVVDADRLRQERGEVVVRHLQVTCADDCGIAGGGVVLFTLATGRASDEPRGRGGGQTKTCFECMRVRRNGGT